MIQRTAPHQIQVHRLAFADNHIGTVTIPEDLPVDIVALLEKVFYYGQNDNQDQQDYSLSVGDAVYLHRKYYLCCVAGFKELSRNAFKKYCQLPREQRVLWAYKQLG